MQPPPNQGHTGVGTDRPGPLDYDPDKLKVMKCSAATGWGKSKAERRTAPGGKAHVRNTVVSTARLWYSAALGRRGVLILAVLVFRYLGLETTTPQQLKRKLDSPEGHQGPSPALGRPVALQQLHCV